jgi:hypothetical protein
MRGIGDTFQPDLHTGTGNYSIPIQAPPGRNGVQPSLTLGYSTGNPNGPFGLGWALEAAGRLDRALEADVLLALAARSRNDGAAAQEHLERALARPTGPSPARAMALAARAVDLMIQDRHDAAIQAGHEALRMGGSLGFPYAEGLALEAIGGARLKRGDPGGKADLERCIAGLTRQHNPAVHYQVTCRATGPRSW